MKKLIHFLIATTFSVNSLAAQWQATDPLPIQITGETADAFDFQVDVPATTQFQAGTTYYFFDGQGWSQGVFLEYLPDGKAHWNYVEKIPSEEMTGQGVPQGLANDRDAKFHSDARSKALNSAVSTGIAQALYRGLVFNQAFREEMGRLGTEINENNRAIAANNQKIETGIQEAKNNYSEFLSSLQNSMQASKAGDFAAGSSLKFESSDAELVKDLRELEGILNSSHSNVPKRIEARNFSYDFIQEADQASARGHAVEANAYKKYAQAFADIALGLDPVTGPIRDVYEAFTGKNLVTGEELDAWSRGFSILGAVTFGFGSKIGRGIKAFEKIGQLFKRDRALVRAVEVDNAVVKRIESVSGSSAKNRALYEKYVQGLRREMEKPVIKDPEAKRLIDSYWRKESKIGNGSTAAAYRYERATGLKVQGRLHTQKMGESLTRVTNWLENNPHASASDRAAMENIAQDILNALKGN